MRMWDKHVLDTSVSFLVPTCLGECLSVGAAGAGEQSAAQSHSFGACACQVSDRLLHEITLKQSEMQAWPCVLYPSRQMVHAS